MTHPLALTGERTLPGIPEEGYWFARHEAAYAWVAAVAADRLAGGRVLEAGSGEGYGAALLAAAGARVVAAVEYDAAACTHARRSYPTVAVVRANLAALPLTPASMDVVVCLQVVEHLWDLRGFLADCAAALAPGGLLVLSTPNRLTFSPGLGRGERPLNPFHVEEFDAAQLADLVSAAGFDDVRVHGLRHGERLTGWEAAHGDLVTAQVDATLAGRWPTQLLDFVATVGAGDFEVTEAGTVDTSLDLLLTARAGGAR